MPPLHPSPTTKPMIIFFTRELNPLSSSLPSSHPNWIKNPSDQISVIMGE